MSPAVMLNEVQMSNSAQPETSSAVELSPEVPRSSESAIFAIPRRLRQPSQLERYRSELRRSHMNPEQRGNLVRLERVVDQFRARNERMALCAIFGARRIEKGQIPQAQLDAALEKIRLEELARATTEEQS